MSARLRNRHYRIIVASVFFSLVLWVSSARADGIDIAWFITRVGGWHRSPLRAVLLIGVLAVADYLLNMLVIVLPAVLSGARVGRAALDMVSFTIIAQVADRAGMLVYSLVVYLLDIVAHVVVKDIGMAALCILAANLVTSGILIWFMTMYVCCSRWGLSRRRGMLISRTAAIFTNPSWAIATAVIPAFSGQAP